MWVSLCHLGPICLGSIRNMNVEIMQASILLEAILIQVYLDSIPAIQEQNSRNIFWNILILDWSQTNMALICHIRWLFIGCFTQKPSLISNTDYNHTDTYISSISLSILWNKDLPNLPPILVPRATTLLASATYHRFRPVLICGAVLIFDCRPIRFEQNKLWVCTKRLSKIETDQSLWSMALAERIMSLGGENVNPLVYNKKALKIHLENSPQNLIPVVFFNLGHRWQGEETQRPGN